MDHRWFKGVPSDQKEARRKELLSYRNAFDELSQLLEEEFEESVPDYDCPSWSHKQADVNGANRKLKQILKLIKTKD
jgi:hypothetical protein